MITGHHSISSSLRSRVKAQADESFTRYISVSLDELPAPPDGWELNLDTTIALKLRGYCDPHRDDYQGRGPAGTPHLNLFWLVSDTSRRLSSLMVEGMSVRMKPGDWAVFDDAQLHAFLADGTWMGLAVQMVRREVNTSQ